jgi:adenosylcobinamide-GDP ribazoletransferase
VRFLVARHGQKTDTLLRPSGREGDRVSNIHPIRRFFTALSLMSIVPVRGAVSAQPDPAVAGWFPLVGGLFGLVGYGIVKIFALLHDQMRVPFLVSIVVVIAWALLSRLLHWDGLADVADGFWGSHDRERRLEIMADSHTGAFGATAIALVAILEVVSIGIVVGAPHELFVLLVPVMSRFSATAAAWFGRPARAGGLGRSVMGTPSVPSMFVALLPLGLVLGALSRGYNAAGLVAGVVAVVCALGVPFVLSRRFGGVTGDVMGASVLLTEAVVLTVLAVAVSAG